jgi:hypothetical protein
VRVSESGREESTHLRHSHGRFSMRCRITSAVPMITPALAPFTNTGDCASTRIYQDMVMSVYLRGSVLECVCDDCAACELSEREEIRDRLTLCLEIDSVCEDCAIVTLESSRGFASSIPRERGRESVCVCMRDRCDVIGVHVSERE